MSVTRKKSIRDVVLINGQLSSHREVPVPYLDQHPMNVFESLCAYDRRFFRLDDHLDRLFDSAHTIGLRIPRRREELRRELKEALRHAPAKGRCFVRLSVQPQYTIISVTERLYPKRWYQKGADLKTTSVKRNLSHAAPPEAKCGQFLNGVFSLLDPSSKDVFDMLFLDSDGFVKETTVWNIFLVRSGVLKTPLPVGILDGVTRRFVIKCAYQERVDVNETFLTRHDIWNADEAFITNTPGQILPVGSLDGRRIGGKIPGPLTRKLNVRFEKEMKRELERTSC